MSARPSWLEVKHGDTPLILSFPHTGTELPPEIEPALADRALALQDTDWWIDRLYAPIAEHFRATTVRTSVSRTVIDVNRDPSGASLYPGRATTGLCPTTTFDGAPLYRPGMEPGEAEVARRKAAFFEPYHDALAGAVQSVRERHGWCVLYDCHSIRSRVPRLFEGELPVLNLGTNDGASCARAIRDIATEFAASSPLTTVTDGRFKGGWITRHYGRPEEHAHALQMEIAQRAYLEAECPPWRFDEWKAGKLRRWLGDIIQAICDEAADLERSR